MDSTLKLKHVIIIIGIGLIVWGISAYVSSCNEEESEARYEYSKELYKVNLGTAEAAGMSKEDALKYVGTPPTKDNK